MFLGRRQLLAANSLWAINPLGRVLTLLMVVLTACKHTAKKSASDPAPDPTAPGTVDDQPTTPAGPENNAVPTVCVSGPGNQILLDTLPLVPERLQADMRCYGDLRSALLVLQLPKYQHGDLQEVFVVDATGKLLAQRSINAYADISASKTLRPLVFDNLRLSTGLRLGLVFYTIDGRFYKYMPEHPLAFEETFAGKKAYGLTPGSVPVSDFDKAQALPTFVAQVANEDFLQGEAGQQQVFQASTSTEFAATEELKGCRITDLMGRELAAYGETFRDIAEHPYFICYRLMETKAGSFYLRTFVKLT